MKKVFIMDSCPDCSEIKNTQYDAGNIEIIDIGKHVRNLKQFILLRDSNESFLKIKEDGKIGIPCLVDEEGTVTLSKDKILCAMNNDHKDIAISHVDKNIVKEEHSYCSLDGKGC
jgi:glutaredoxin-related protein